MINPLIVRTNVDHIQDVITGLMERLGFDRGSLGDDLAELVSEEMHARCLREEAPDGSAWKENDPEYKKSKGNLPVGIRTGEMLDPANFRGDVRITKSSVRVKYGGSRRAREHLRYFQEGGRRAWGLDQQIKDKVMRLLREREKENLRV